MSWHNGLIVMFDLETSGVDPHRDRIVTAACIEVGPGVPRQARTWLLNPGIEIPEGAEPAGAIYEIAQLLARAAHAGAAIVGHNVVYDLTMLWAELTRHGMSAEADQIAGLECVVDTMVLDKWADPYRKGSRRLVDVANHYGVALSEEDAHGAEADALAAGRVAWKIAQAKPSLQVGVAELHGWQVAWKREQAESFGRYLTKQGKTDDVSREWPVQSPPAGWSPDQLPVAREAVAS